MRQCAISLLCCGFVASLQAAEQSPSRDNGPSPHCGLNTLYVSLLALDADVEPFREFRDKLGEAPPDGFSLGQLAEAAERYSMKTLGVTTTVENLQRRKGRFACIAHVRGNHFLNVGQIEDGVAFITDPPRTYHLPVATLQSQWAGVALLISPDPLVAEEDLPRAFPWSLVLYCSTGVLAVFTTVALLRRWGRSESHTGAAL